MIESVFSGNELANLSLYCLAACLERHALTSARRHPRLGSAPRIPTSRAVKEADSPCHGWLFIPASGAP